MDTPTDTPTDSFPASAPSLLGLRLAAAAGLAVAIALVVAGFTLAWWVGLVALATVPILPTGFVFAVEVLGRQLGR